LLPFPGRNEKKTKRHIFIEKKIIILTFETRFLARLNFLLA